MCEELYPLSNCVSEKIQIKIRTTWQKISAELVPKSCCIEVKLCNTIPKYLRYPLVQSDDLNSGLWCFPFHSISSNFSFSFFLSLKFIHWSLTAEDKSLLHVVSKMLLIVVVGII
jgi:hypothetical protein